MSAPPTELGSGGGDEPARAEVARAEAERGEPARFSEELRARILAAPEAVLEDAEIMRVLLRPADGADRRILDLRGAQVDRLQRRLGRLSEAHRDVVQSAWDHMTGMGRAQHAVLALLDGPGGLDESLALRVRRWLPALLDVDEARLCFARDPLRCVATDRPACDEPRTLGGRARRWLSATARRSRRLARRLTRADEACVRAHEADAVLLSPAALAAYSPRPRSRPRARAWRAGPMFPTAGARREPPEETAAGRAREMSNDLAFNPEDGPSASILLREPEPQDALVFGPAADELGAVAVVALDLGPDRAPAALALGAADANRFRAGYTVELLAFLAGVVERLVRSDPV